MAGHRRREHDVLRRRHPCRPRRPAQLLRHQRRRSPRGRRSRRWSCSRRGGPGRCSPRRAALAAAAVGVRPRPRPVLRERHGRGRPDGQRGRPPGTRGDVGARVDDRPDFFTCATPGQCRCGRHLLRVRPRVRPPSGSRHRPCRTGSCSTRDRSSGAPRSVRTASRSPSAATRGGLSAANVSAFSVRPAGTWPGGSGT